jgi:hypothetical protein
MLFLKQPRTKKKIRSKEQKDLIQVRSIAGTYQELLRAAVAAKSPSAQWF